MSALNPKLPRFCAWRKIAAVSAGNITRKPSMRCLSMIRRLLAKRKVVSSTYISGRENKPLVKKTSCPLPLLLPHCMALCGRIRRKCHRGMYPTLISRCQPTTSPQFLQPTEKRLLFAAAVRGRPRLSDGVWRRRVSFCSIMAVIANTEWNLAQT